MDPFLRCWPSANTSCRAKNQSDLVRRDVVILYTGPQPYQTYASQWDKAFKPNTSWTDILDQRTITLQRSGKVTFKSLPRERVLESVFFVPRHSARETRIKGLHVIDPEGVKAGDQHNYSGRLNWWHQC